MLHAELRKLAHRHLSRDRADHTLSPTELVHDAWMRLIRPDAGDWASRRHFYALASKMMRSLLVDHARRRNADRRGGGARRLTMHFDPASPAKADVDLLCLHESLEGLERMDEQLARVAELRLFAGLELPDIAGQLDITLRTAERRWRTARAWLAAELRDDG